MSVPPNVRDNARDAAGVFRKPWDEQERKHCRLDLHKTQMGSMTTAEFVEKWGDRLDVLLDPR